MPSHRDGAKKTLISAAGPDDPASRADLGRPMILPVLPSAPGGIAVLCPPEDVGYAETELVAPLVKAGFQVSLGPIPLDAPPGWIPEIPDSSCRLVLLDIAPKDQHGYHFCAELRDRLGLPLMLVLRGAAGEDVLRGYESGADSCLSAPFDGREFLARLAALLRREPPPSPGPRSTE